MTLTARERKCVNIGAACVSTQPAKSGSDSTNHMSLNSNIVSSANSSQPPLSADSQPLVSTTEGENLASTAHTVSDSDDHPTLYPTDPFSQGFYGDDEVNYDDLMLRAYGTIPLQSVGTENESCWQTW